MTDILIVAEHIRGELRQTSLELVGAALALNSPGAGSVRVAIMGVDKSSPMVEQLNCVGVDEIIVVPDVPVDFDPLVYEEVVLQLGRAHQVNVILIGHSVSGMAFAPAIATSLGC